jgi:hypothetical protein
MFKRLFCLALFAASFSNAFATTTITATVDNTGKYLVTSMPVNTTTPAVLKFSFENITSGTTLELCAGTFADYSAGTCATRLSDSGGPGYVLLSIIDTPAVAGKIIFVVRAVGSAASIFKLTID